MRRLAILASMTLTSCVSVSPVDADQRIGRMATYIGIVRIRVPNNGDGLRVADVRTLGAGWDGAAFLGWRSGQWVTADPARCQLLVVIRSGVDAASAEGIFKALGDKRPCIADFRKEARQPSSSPPR